MKNFTQQLETPIAILSLCGLFLHVVLRYSIDDTVLFSTVRISDIPLLIALIGGGLPLVVQLFIKMLRREFGSDLLAGISIATSLILQEYLAGTLVVLMLSGGAVLEAFATKSASSVLNALAKRMPLVAQKKTSDGLLIEVPLLEVGIGDHLVVFPHALCPVDGTVIEGHGTMDESYLTGEPYNVSKAPGTSVLSGAINGESALTITCEKPAQDSRYAKIMQVMRDSEQQRPQLRRLGDALGSWYTPLAVVLALTAWIITGDSLRFLSVLVVATPCPLLIAIPVAIISSISLAAKMGIIIKDPAVLENISTCRTAIFDKTGTLTYGKPKVTEILPAADITEEEVLRLVASVERYSKHPLAGALLEAAQERGISLVQASEVLELPGDGLRAKIDGKAIHVTSRKKLAKYYPDLSLALPPIAAGMECVIIVDSRYAATIRLRDELRSDGIAFIQHLKPNHGVQRVMLVSGDRESEVRYIADHVGISEVHASQSPEQKLAIVRAETLKNSTIFLGDGINDAPALTAATVGIAFGNNSEITGEAADAVILDSSLAKVDVLFHIGTRMRMIVLQSAIGGMLASIVGMILAATGVLTPVSGAVTQEIIDIVAVANALRAALPPKKLSDV
jgi:heavy metal translocating P-type ATPase